MLPNTEITCAANAELSTQLTIKRQSGRTTRNARDRSSVKCIVCYLAQETTTRRSPREEEYVSIIDPRHALYGQKLRLVQIANRSKEETSSCTVELCADVWRRIPLSVTDLGNNEPVLYPLPLNLTVMRQLLELFRRIEIQCQEGTSDENKDQPASDSTPKRKQRTKSTPAATLATSEAKATTGTFTKHQPNLLATGASDRTTKAGGEA